MPVLNATLYNDLEFKAEDAFASVLATVAGVLGLPLKKSLCADALEAEHIAIIAEDGDPSEGHKNTGNYRIPIRIKIATAIDGSASDAVREVHRQRVGQVRDTLFVHNLPALLSAAVANFTVQDFFVGRLTQRIQGRHWITETTLTLDPVCGTDE